MAFDQASREKGREIQRAWGQKAALYGCDECVDRLKRRCKLNDPCKYAATFEDCGSYSEYTKRTCVEQMLACDRVNKEKQQPWRIKPMEILDTTTGHRYPNIAAAAKAFGCSEEYLAAHLKGVYSSCKGHVFQWTAKL